MRPNTLVRFIQALTLLAAVAAAVDASADPAAAHPHYPKLGLYGFTRSDGWPLVRDDDSIDPAVVARLARYDAVVLPATPFTEYRPDVLAALRAAHPGIALYAYVQADYTWYAAQPDSNVHLPTRHYQLVRNLNGFLYDTLGGMPPEANINLAKKQGSRYVVAEALADFWASALAATGKWDGIFFDRCCQSILWQESASMTFDYARAGYANRSAFDLGWQAGTDTLSARLRRKAGNTIVLIGNCGQGVQYAAFNGWMRENFPIQNGGTWESNVFGTPGGYMTDETSFRSPQVNWVTSWPVDPLTPYTPEHARRVRLGLATAALGEGFGTFNPSNLDLSTGYWNWWFDEYGVDLATGRSSSLPQDTGWLGEALGSYYKTYYVTPDYDAADNPGFENDVASWAVVTATGATATRQAWEAPVGGACAKLTIPSAGANALSTKFATAGRGVPVLTANVCSATFWARAESQRAITVAATNAWTGATFDSRQIWIDATWRRYQVELTPLEPGLAQLEFRLGGSAADVWLDDCHLQLGANSLYRRDFQHGIVLVNPGGQANVQLEETYRRILGTVAPAINDGAFVTQTLVNGSDALFLIRASSIPVAVPAAPAAASLRWSTVAPNPARAGEGVHAVLELPSVTVPEVAVFDAAGRRVRTLDAGRATETGPRAVAWDGRDANGRRVPPGLYFLRAVAGGATATRKIVTW